MGANRKGTSVRMGKLSFDSPGKELASVGALACSNSNSTQLPDKTLTRATRPAGGNCG